MSKLHHPQGSARGQRGFSLIEVLVGMLIAMVGVVIMMEVLLSADQRGRTTGATNDAMSSGVIMLHMINRDLVQAGYGINSVALLGCSVTLPTGPTIPLAPVTINPPAATLPAGDANTDTLLVVYGSDNGQPEGNTVFSITGTQYAMQAPTSFAVNDRVVALPEACGATALPLAQVTAITAMNITVSSVIANANTVYNLGRAPRIVGYAVRGGALTSCDYMSVNCAEAANVNVNWVQVASNVVSMRAQYGRDTAAGVMDGIVDVWDQATPAGSCQWARTSAVRFALVARSNEFATRINAVTGQREPDPVTTTDRTWAGSAGAPIDLTQTAMEGGISQWQAYRYRTFENVAPSRNVVWMGTTGC